MPLYHIQDGDRPAWVVAPTFVDALAKWQKAVASENDGDIGPPPNGIAHICDDQDLIVDADFKA